MNMGNSQEKFDNLARKIRGKNISWLQAIKEYLSSFVGLQKLSPKIQKALQDTHEKTEGILSDIKK